MTGMVDLKRPAKLFLENNVILFPTDTVVGLGCRLDSKEPIERIRKLKGIIVKSPLAVLISSDDHLKSLKVRRSRLANELIERFWPGALTIVLTTENDYPCCGEGNTIGLRMPDDPLLRKMIDVVGIPIAATSANLHGNTPPARLKDVTNKISDAVDFMVDLPISGSGQPSTVVRVEGGTVRIVRQGAITLNELKDIAGDSLIK